MKVRHRRIHRLTWLLLLPVLLIAVLLFNQPEGNSIPQIESVPGLDDASNGQLNHRILP